MPRAIVRGALILGLLTLAGCAPSIGFLNPAGPVAADQRMHFWIICALFLFVLLPIFLGIPFIIWRYRYGAARSRAEYRPDWEYSGRWELFLWGGPAVLVIVLATLLWSHTIKLDPYRPLSPDPLEVQVVAYDWAWLFIYPEQDVATVNRLVIPAGRAVSLRLTSRSVMQSFFVPSLAGQIYVMGGMETRLNLMADAAGQWRGRNSQYNGEGFHQQTFVAEAVSPTAFSDWSAEARSAPPLDLALAMARHMPDDAPRLFGSVPADLFEHLLSDHPHEAPR